MTVFIHDASILLDLIHVELLGAFPAIPARMLTTDLEVREKMNAVLLTGDNRLRTEASQAGIEVHGTVWAFDELITRGIVTSNRAARGLTDLMSINPRLPRQECEKRIHRWRS